MITFAANIPGQTQTLPLGDLCGAAAAGRRGEGDAAGGDLLCLAMSGLVGAELLQRWCEAAGG